MAKQETFRGNDVSALSAATYMVGALKVVYTQLDLIEGVDKMWRYSFESDPKALVSAWPKVLESVKAMREALGQGDT